jgi:hypothetical protein
MLCKDARNGKFDEPTQTMPLGALREIAFRVNWLIAVVEPRVGDSPILSSRVALSLTCKMAITASHTISEPQDEWLLQVVSGLSTLCQPTTIDGAM